MGYIDNVVKVSAYIFLVLSFSFVIGIIVYWSVVMPNLQEGTTKPAKLTKTSGTNVTPDDTCNVWQLVGDGYCDDEANIAQCGYDLYDCCKLENDRTLCQNCTCIQPEEKVQNIHKGYCELLGEQWGLWNHEFIGDGNCHLQYNKAEFYFDIGDCCLSDEDLSCFEETFAKVPIGPKTFAEIPCPENPCILSNTFCIEEELGDGICQDYNNGPLCDYDMGDCCNFGYSANFEIWYKFEDCCTCTCK